MFVEILGNIYIIWITTSLDLLKKNLTSFPENIFKLKYIKCLVLSDNSLTSLPENIGDLTKLKELHLANNNLISLPDSIGRLTQLEHLCLHKNKLTKLPQTIKNLNINFLSIPITSYQINNLDAECEFLIITDLEEPLNNLPINLKELYLIRPKIDVETIKVPFNCKIVIKI